MQKIKPEKNANIKIYSQKAIDNSKKSKPKTISFSGTNAKPKNENIDLFLSRLCPFKSWMQTSYITFLFRTLWQFYSKV